MKFSFTFSRMTVVAFIGVVDLVPIGEDADIKLPYVTLCLIDPFVDERLRKTIPKLDEDSYLRHLKGDYYNKTIEMVPYINVSFHEF